jgi:hypothetical protein
MEMKNIQSKNDAVNRLRLAGKMPIKSIDKEEVKEDE